MQTDHVFSRVSEDANRVETEVSNKRGCCTCVRLFKELSRCKRTQGPLIRTADATGLSRASIKRL